MGNWVSSRRLDRRGGRCAAQQCVMGPWAGLGACGKVRGTCVLPVLSAECSRCHPTRIQSLKHHPAGPDCVYGAYCDCISYARDS